MENVQYKTAPPLFQVTSIYWVPTSHPAGITKQDQLSSTVSFVREADVPSHPSTQPIEASPM